MIFRKTERRKWPTVLGITVGALAVVGFMSIKNRGKDMVCGAAHKMKSVLHKKGSCEEPLHMS